MGKGWASIALALAAALLAGHALADDQAGKLKNDRLSTAGAIEEGVLPSGLRYAFLRSRNPKDAVSIRLVIKAGAFDEDDAERGAAHFVEHMTYATARGGSAAMVAAFQAIGVQHGKDLNAATGLFDTTYRVDLPKADKASLDLSFQWLRSVADGASFPADAVDRERGVIMSERDTRETGTRNLREAIMLFDTAGARVADRARVEPAASIAGQTPERLRAFYERWYRPDNAIVVVVGEMSPRDMKKRVEAAFSSWTAQGPLPERVRSQALDASAGQAVMTRAEPDLPGYVSICRESAIDPGGVHDTASLRAALQALAWSQILDKRLDRLSRGDRPPFLAARSETQTTGRDSRMTCLLAVPLIDGWKTALQALQDELRRFEAHGPTNDEASEAIKAAKAAYGLAAFSITLGSSKAAANTIAETEALGQPRPDWLQAVAAAARAMDGENADTLRAAFLRSWSGSGPRIAVVGAPAPDPAAVRGAWDGGQTGNALNQTEAAPTVAWPYATFGPAGTVARRQGLHNPDFTRVTFANGVVLNVKTTNPRSSVSEVRVRFGAGRRELPAGGYYPAVMGSGVLTAMGLGKLDAEGLGRALGAKPWTIDLQIKPSAFVLGGRSSDLDTELSVMAAFISDPGFRSGAETRLPSATQAAYRLMQSTPRLAIERAYEDAVTRGAPEPFLTEAQARALKVADFERLLKAPLTHDPLEITVAGPLDERRVIALVGATFGALPARTGEPRARTDAWFRSGLGEPVAPIQVTLGGPDAAVAGAVWPLFVSGAERRKDQFAVLLATRMLDERLVQRVRLQMGKTYTPQEWALFDDDGDQGYLLVALDTTAADITAVQAEIGQAGQAIARGEFDAALFERERKRLSDLLDAQAPSTLWWADMLDGSFRDPARLVDFTGRRAIIAKLTADDVKQAAAQWLSRPPTLIAGTSTRTP